MSLFDLFVMATWWDWSLSLVFIVVVLLSLGFENYAAADVAGVVFLFLISWLGSADPLNFLMDHPGQFLAYVGLYVLIGLGYSVIKYSSYIRRVASAVKEAKESYVAQQKVRLLETGHSEDRLSRILAGDGEFNKEQQDAWIRFRNENVSSTIRQAIRDGLTPKQMTVPITNWVIFWPISAIALFAFDPVLDLIHWSVRKFRGIYQIVYRWVMRGINIKDIT